MIKKHNSYTWLNIKHTEVCEAKSNSFFFLIFKVYLLLRDKERQSMSRGGAERGRHRI